MKLSENLLQFIWKYRLFKQTNIQTLSNKALRIKNVGSQNHNEGPDFENAFLSIEGIEWIGNVEVHLYSSEWNNHKHQFNPKYNNVILHVVYQYTGEIMRADGTIPETLVLQSLIDNNVLHKYHLMMSSKYWIPCEKLIDSVDSFYTQQWLHRVLFERLISKTEFLNKILDEYQGDWTKASYILLARSFGLNVNADAFELLARSLPFKLIKKYDHDPMTVEALLFGQAGMLDDNFKEDYPRHLQHRYNYLRKIHKLKPIERPNWRFLRMRPANFPTIRLAQFAAFCCTKKHFFADIIKIENLDLWSIQFNNLKVNEYWLTHYHFQKKTVKHNIQLGEGAVNLILINCIVMLLFSYGKYINNDDYINRSLFFLERIKPENNQITKRYKELGIGIRSAADTQALKQLKIIYCDNKRCLNCEIGSQIIKKNKK